ncbi:ornithine carbamoyltransferase [Ceraceosorus bombacis]|uniref:ornithine carbamoyltransferase n=1 Tax=Ceraceosorus bombacis TaxID=401625 RepID=A0A0P1BLG0_9BASI|nr:ornithine carbamoyltransferase [Ceraceosorus bombacis]
MLLQPASASALVRGSGASSKQLTRVMQQQHSGKVFSHLALAAKRSFSSTTGAQSELRKPPHLLSLADLSVPQISSILERSAELKSISRASDLAFSSSPAAGKYQGGRILPQSLQGKNVAVIFSKRSTRTRVASETSIASLGGHPLFLSSADIQLGVNESLFDTSKVVSSMCDGIMARVGGHEEVELLAKHSRVPVINALSARYHPTQILADLLTMLEDPVIGGTSSASLDTLRGIKVAWIGDSNNILADMLVAFPRLGIHLSVATPQGDQYKKDEIVWQDMQDGLKEETSYEKGKVEWGNDPLAAANNADIVVTDTWVSMGDESQKTQRLKDFSGFQITESLLQKAGAKKSARFMHCLPRKPDEVDDEVFYGPRSIVFEEAENRKWTIMALFDRMIGEWKY